MNHSCLYLGHEWGEWKWSSGCSDLMIAGISMGPRHTEIRSCMKCKERQIKENLPGKYDGMDSDQLKQVREMEEKKWSENV